MGRNRNPYRRGEQAPGREDSISPVLTAGTPATSVADTETANSSSGAAAASAVETIRAQRPAGDGERWVVFQNPGPGTFAGDIDGSPLARPLPVCVPMSFPERLIDECVEKGLEFVRWAQ